MELSKEIYDYYYDRNFLYKDRQLGQNVILNGKNVYDLFDADLISVQINPSQINKDIYKSLGKHSLKINTFNYGVGSMQMTFYVGGHSIQDAQINVNKLLQQFDNKVVVIKFDESDFEYNCIIDSYDSVYTGVDFYYHVTINASITKHLPIVELDYPASVFNTSENVIINFENSGTVISGLDIVIRVTGISNFQLAYKRENGKTHTVHFEDISTSNYFYKLGGLDGVVYRSGDINFGTYINVFKNTDLMDFPVVHPGENSIIFNNGQANSNIKEVIISYYPTFLI